MSLHVDRVEKTVVKEWQETRFLVCDHCATRIQVDPPIYGKGRPDPSGWLVVKRWDLPPWYDLECRNVTVRHFDSLVCLTAWANSERQARD